MAQFSTHTPRVRANAGLHALPLENRRQIPNAAGVVLLNGPHESVGAMVETHSAAAPARRGRPGYDQQTVLHRAIDLFNRQGYEGTSMGDLARELGFTKSAIYHHVPSKQHLLEQALNEALDGLTAMIDAARGASAGNAYEQLRSAVRGSVEILIMHLPAVTLLLRVRGNSEVELEALRRRRELDDMLAELVEAAIIEGAIRDDIPADLTSRLLFGMVNSLVEWVRPDGRYEPVVLADAVTALAFDGLRQQAGSAPGTRPRPSRRRKR